MSECTHDCSTCSSGCADKKPDLMALPHPNSNVRKVIGVVSGKGGVGKSLVTSLMAVEMARRGYDTAVLDADITGPSIPKAFGINEQATGSDEGINPCVSKCGTKVMSLNLLLENPEDPVVWRGAIISNTVRQFWTEVMWGDVDIMFIDMPPGTGDVTLTVFQSLPLDGIIVVTSPQDLVTMIVEKALKMAKLMNIPVLGIVENMSYFKCDECGKTHNIYGQSKLEQIAAKHEISCTEALPIDPSIADLCDRGEIESVKGEWLGKLCDKMESL